MAFTRAVTGNQINASDLNQIMNILQPLAGAQEQERYYLVYAAYATNAVGSLWLQSQSHNLTPVSASITTSIQSPTGNAGAPAIANLTWTGGQVTSTASAASLQAKCGGDVFFQY